MKKALILLAVSSLLVGGSSLVIGDSGRQPGTSPIVTCSMRMPAGSILYNSIPNVTLEISPETDTAIVYIGATRSPSNQWVTPEATIVDLKTGELTRVADLVGKGKEQGTTCRFSASRSHLLVHWMSPKGTTVYAVGLPDGAPVQIAQGKVMALWAGNFVVVTTMTKSGKLSRVLLVDPSTGESKQLPVCGMVSAGLPDGTFLMGGDPSALEAPVSLAKAVGQGRLLHIDSAGKVLADIAPIGIVSSPPVVSKNGKFIAFQSKPADAPEGPNTRYGFTVLSVDGTSRQQQDMPCFPVAVMDDGSAVAMKCEFDERNTAPLCLVSSDGQTIKDIGRAVSAAVMGESLIYASNTDRPTIKTMSLAKE